ncbi:hypothetical protein RvY_10129 [Ramazzottius varieornatus]|uniref:Uncharacterized protein n=1 Tax=Ramazzottius varieornatus TaxID=947166 RepID=A0A1D1VBS5_RAMVA|nr:hypothetical protein RvY_10129 [Ramazzottius varieornatus]
MNLVKDAVGKKVRPLSGAVMRYDCKGFSRLVHFTRRALLYCSLVTMGGRPVKHVKDLEPNAYYVVLGPGERFSAFTPYRPDGLHEDHVKPRIVKYEARRPRAKNQRLDDVRRYPISDFLLMSDTSLVDHGFEPIHGQKAQDERRHVEHRPELHRSPPTNTEEELHGPGRPRAKGDYSSRKVDESKSRRINQGESHDFDHEEGARIPEIPDSVVLPVHQPNTWADPRRVF